MSTSYQPIDLDQGLVGAAVARAAKLPVFEGSHRKEAANLVGCIGEVVMERYFTVKGIEFERRLESTTEDYLVGRKFTLDVKTKDRTVVPKDYFDNSVPLYNHDHQRPDYYYFVSLLRDKSIDENDPRRFVKAFILGGMDINTLDRTGKRWEAGETDPSNGTKFWTACINLRMLDLLSNSQMLDIFR